MEKVNVGHAKDVLLDGRVGGRNEAPAHDSDILIIALVDEAGHYHSNMRVLTANSSIYVLNESESCST